jgi:hypothetical protein
MQVDDESDDSNAKSSQRITGLEEGGREVNAEKMRKYI